MEVSSLHEAVNIKDITAIRNLISEGADVNETEKNRLRRTPLHVAALTNNDEIARILLDEGAEVDARQVDSNTPLHLAVDNNNVKVLKLLISRGADVSEIDSYGYTPLQTALMKGDLEVAKMLLDAGADVDTKSKSFEDTVLHLAAKLNNISMIEYLLSRETVYVDVENEKSQTPLHYAAIECKCDKHLEVIRILLENQADPEAIDEEGKKPIDYLKINGKSNCQTVKLVSKFMKHETRDESSISNSKGTDSEKPSPDQDPKIFAEYEVSHVQKNLQKSGNFLSESQESEKIQKNQDQLIKMLTEIKEDNAENRKNVEESKEKLRRLEGSVKNLIYLSIVITTLLILNLFCLIKNDVFEVS